MACGIVICTQELSDTQIKEFLSKGMIMVCDQELCEGDIRLSHSFTGEKAKELSQRYQAHSSNGVLVLLDVTPDQEMLDEGIAREIINRIQKLRKKAHLVPSDPISVYVSVEPASDHLSTVVKNFHEFIENALKVPLKCLPHGLNRKPVIEEIVEVKGATLSIIIFSEEQKHSPEKKIKLSPAQLQNNSNPVCRYVNVILCNASKPDSKECPCGTILLENPPGQYLLSMESLYQMVKIVFGLHGRNPKLFLTSDRKNEVCSLTTEEIVDLHSKTLYACV